MRKAVDRFLRQNNTLWVRQKWLTCACAACCLFFDVSFQPVSTRRKHSWHLKGALHSNRNRRPTLQHSQRTGRISPADAPSVSALRRAVPSAAQRTACTLSQATPPNSSSYLVFWDAGKVLVQIETSTVSLSRAGGLHVDDLRSSINVHNLWRGLQRLLKARPRQASAAAERKPQQTVLGLAFQTIAHECCFFRGPCMLKARRVEEQEHSTRSKCSWKSTPRR